MIGPRQVFVTFSQDEVSQSMRTDSGAVSANKQPTVTTLSTGAEVAWTQYLFSFVSQTVRNKWNLSDFTFWPRTSSQGQDQGQGLGTKAKGKDFGIKAKAMSSRTHHWS